MKNKVSQVRVTVPKWIVKLKEWEIETQLEFVPLIKDDNKPITKETVFIIKEVK